MLTSLSAIQALIILEKIRNFASIHDYSQHSKNKNLANHLEQFLVNAKVEECNNEQRGITWIEMYILYSIRGNPAPFQHEEGKAKAKKTASQQIKEFTKQARAGIARTVAVEDLKLFKPHKSQKRDVFRNIAVDLTRQL